MGFFILHARFNRSMKEKLKKGYNLGLKIKKEKENGKLKKDRRKIKKRI